MKHQYFVVPENNGTNLIVFGESEAKWERLPVIAWVLHVDENGSVLYPNPVTSEGTFESIRNVFVETCCGGEVSWRLGAQHDVDTIFRTFDEVVARAATIAKEDEEEYQRKFGHLPYRSLGELTAALEARKKQAEQ